MEIVVGAFCALLGLVVGSFLNVVIYRVPRGTFLSGSSRSHCPACDAPIRARDNIPVLGWLLLRGRARCCAARISIRYPVVELLTGIAFFLLYLHRAPFLEDGALQPRVFLFLVEAWLVASILAASAIDLEFRILPDAINFLGIGVGLLASALLPELHAESWLTGQVSGVGPNALSVLDALLGLLCGAGALYLVAVLGKLVYRTDAMGLGDVKFMAFTGCFLGPDGVLLTLLIACVVGALVGLILAIKTGDPLIPFGPFLAVGVIVARFFGAETSELVFRRWPEWMRTSDLAVPFLIVFSVLCLLALFALRRIRRKASEDEPHEPFDDEGGSFRYPGFSFRPFGGGGS